MFLNLRIEESLTDFEIASPKSDYTFLKVYQINQNRVFGTYLTD